MSLAELVAALPEAARRQLDSASPMPMRMMAAKGLAPLPPLEMVIVVCGLTLDADPKIADAARQTLGNLADKILLPSIDGGLPPAALTILAPTLVTRDAALEKLVLNRKAPDAVIAQVASAVSTDIAEIISNNQERLLRSEALVRSIARNPNILRSSLDRIFDFMVRAGVIYGDMPEFSEAVARLSSTEIQAAAEKIELPVDVVKALIDDGGKASAGTTTPVVDPDTIVETLEKSGSLEEKAERVPVLKLIASLNPAQRIALAVRGNREARTILVRDPNRTVAAAAIRSPRITEQEIISAAQSRSVGDEVVRIIANSKDMVRPYMVKLALVNNPKTPMQTAMHLLTLLRASDQKAVAKSKNVPSAVANHAKRLVNVKAGGGH